MAKFPGVQQVQKKRPKSSCKYYLDFGRIFGLPKKCALQNPSYGIKNSRKSTKRGAGLGTPSLFHARAHGTVTFSYFEYLLRENKKCRY